MSPSVDLLRRAVLRHTPDRHGLMLPPNPSAKYRERRTAPTEDQLRRHLAGEITLAVPATSHDLAACIVYDIDGDGLVTITALLAAAQGRGLWAWSEWHLATDRGYVWIPFDRLTNAAALHHLGQQLILDADLRPEQLHVLDQRTANNAITRLPFGRHTHTGQRGDLIFQDGAWADLDSDPEEALALWASRYRENPASQVTPMMGLTADSPETGQRTDGRRTAPAPTQPKKQICQAKYFIKDAEIQQRWNATHTIEDILAAAGGRRAGRTAWHCPCGQHRHDDQTPSLLLRPAKRTFYGNTIVQGYSPACAFHHPRLVFDAFNVYRILHGLSNSEMLQLARRELGLDTPERPQMARKDSEGGQRRPTTQPVAQRPTQAMIAPPPQVASATAILERAAGDCTLSPATRTVLTTILAILGNRPSAPIRLATLISQTNLARRTIQAAQRRLEAAGYLVIAPQANHWGGQLANHYTLGMGGGDHGDHPLKLTTWKGGQSSRPSAEPTAAAASPAPAPAPAAPPFPVESAAALTAAPDPVPAVALAPPFHVPLSPDMPQGDEPATEAASFDPAIYAAWAAALDDQAARPWSAGRSPRQVMLGHEFGLAELRRSQVEHAPLVTSAPPPAPPAPRLRQTALRLTVPAIAPAPVAGVQALRAELARLEREARRYFAQQAPTAGKQTQQRAAAVRRQLAELEASAAPQRETSTPTSSTAECGQIAPPSMRSEQPRKRRKSAQQQGFMSPASHIGPDCASGEGAVLLRRSAQGRG